MLGVLSTSVVGCQGILGDVSEDGAQSELPEAGTADLPAVSTRYRRLTHEEWENSVMDLFGFAEPTGASSGFRNDPRQGGFYFDGNGGSLKVDQALWGAYQKAALEVAARVAADTAILNRIAPAAANDTERARGFIESFGRRVHRRPLTAEQTAKYLELHALGVTSYEDSSGFAAGARLVIEALLQSPFFLYRVEDSQDVVDGTIPLDAYERASRLSYFLTGSMPDDALLAAAENGSLDDASGIRVQAERLLDSPRAKVVVERYFEGVLDVERYKRIAPSTTFFPNAPYDLKAFAKEETRLFVSEEIFAKGGGFTELLTSTATYANSHLGTIYGVTQILGDTFQRVELDASQRRGVLTQVGFLASHATSVDPDPIHRGVFLAKRISCFDIAAPPDAVPPLPDPADLSNRELVEQHTQNPESTCANCHSTVINPYGFAFEHYDATGAFRTEDRGHVVDSKTSPFIDGEPTEVKDALDLATRLAGSKTVHECFVGHLVEFALGRDLAPEDEFLKREFGQSSLAGELSLRGLLLEVASSRSFLDRAVDTTETIEPLEEGAE